MKPQNRRRFRSHLVNHELRLRLVIDDMLFSLIAALTAVGLLYYMSNREIGDTLWSAHISIKETRQLLENGAKVAGVVTFIAVTIFGFWSALDAHRIAGPMHRLKRLLDEIASGNLSHDIHFRKRDEFQDLAASTDALVDGYSERIRQLRKTVDTLEAAAQDLPPAQQVEVNEISASLKSQLAFFKTSEPES